MGEIVNAAHLLGIALAVILPQAGAMARPFYLQLTR